MRVGFYVGEIQDKTLGGGHTFQMSIIEGLTKIKCGHEFYFYYKADTNLFDSNENIKFINMKFESSAVKKRKLFSKKNKKHCVSLNELVLRDKIEFVYFLPPHYEKVSAPFALTIWDLGHRKETYFPEVSTEGDAFIHREYFYSTAPIQASYVIIGNNTGKEQLEYFYRVEPRRIKTIPMPTPDYVYELKEDVSILEKYNLEKNKYIFYPAQFWAHKNHIRLVKAMKKLKEQGSDFNMVFTGADQGNLNYIKDKTREFGLEDDILFLGFIKKEEIIALYKNAYALAYASYLGPDNLPPLEAMALKCPVLAADVDGFREQLGNCALFFNPKSEDDLIKQIKLLENIELREKLITDGESLAKKSSIENYVSKIIEIIDDFVPIRECWE